MINAIINPSQTVFIAFFQSLSPPQYRDPHPHPAGVGHIHQPTPPLNPRPRPDWVI
jgi:hypothetical protein